jgi:hypothetical protein
MDLNTLPTPAPQDLIVLPPAKRAAVALKSEAAEAHLRDLVAKSAAITSVVDKNGREEAHRAAMGLKNARVAVDKTGEEAREDAVAFQKAVVAEVKRLAAITADEEKRLLALRDAYDAKVAAEKAERERIEAARVAAIRTKIDAIKGLPLAHAASNSTQLSAVLADLSKIEVTEEYFAEFAPEAAQVVDAAAEALLNLRTAARQREAEEAERQRKAEADRLELARLRREQEAREQAEREAAAERERLAKIEADRIEAERRAAAEREADLQRRIAEMKAQMEASQHAMAPVVEPVPSPVAEAAASPVDLPVPSPVLEVPLFTEGQPTTMGVEISNCPVRPDAGDILDVLMREFNADEMTVMAWLTDLVMEQGL